MIAASGVTPMPTEQIMRAQADSYSRGVLSIWTIYDHPKDFPSSYVARRHEIGEGVVRPTDDIVQGDLRIIRKSFEQCGLTRMPRDAADEPQIMESWL